MNKDDLLHEYSTHLRNTGDAFIKGKITYEEYLQKIDEYTKIAGKLWDTL